MEEKNPLPTLTPEQRKAALAKAVYARKERAAFKAACKAGNIAPEVAIEAPIAARLKVDEFARSFPGIGPATAKVILDVCHIRGSSRISSLGYVQGPRFVAAIKENMKKEGE